MFSFSHTPSAGLESFLAGRNRLGPQPGERRGGQSHAHIRITVLAREKIRRTLPNKSGLSFLVIRTAAHSVHLSGLHLCSRPMRRDRGLRDFMWGTAPVSEILITPPRR